MLLIAIIVEFIEFPLVRGSIQKKIGEKLKVTQLKQNITQENKHIKLQYYGNGNTNQNV